MGALTVVRPSIDRYEDPEMIKTLKETVCKGASDSQFRMFIEICRGTGLNPFLKEIWYVPSVGIIAARDGYLRVANENRNFDGMETKVERDAKGTPIKATCSVWRKDRSHPVTCEAYFSEYKKGGNVWTTYPSAMISKVAEVLALKRSFSINGVVSEEEIGFDETPKGKTKAEKTEDARAVGENKLAEMKALGVSQEDATIIHNAEFVDPPPESPSDLEKQLEESVKQANWIKKMMVVFADLKEKLGEEDYRGILTRAGYANKQALMKAGYDEAQRICKIMIGKHKYLKVRAGDLEELAEMRAKDPDFEAWVAANASITWDDLQQATGEEIIKVLAAARERV